MTPRTRPPEPTFWLVLSYVGPLALLPLLAGPASTQLRFHARQGLTLFLAAASLGLALRILSALPFIGWIAGLLGNWLSPCLVAVSVLAIFRALRGERWEIPGVATLVSRFWPAAD